MAWKTIKGRSYYYRNYRVGGQVHSEYIGAGELGRLAARLDAAEHRKQKAQREALRREITAQDKVDEQIDELGDQISSLVTAVLLVSGYHTHRRQWRRRRDHND
jgi:hypothetical protein